MGFPIPLLRFRAKSMRGIERSGDWWALAEIGVKPHAPPRVDIFPLGCECKTQ
jgi:hypothetical protein